MKDISIYTKEIQSTNDRFWAASGLDDLYPITYSGQGEFFMQRAQKKGTCKYARNHHTLSKETRYGYLRCGGEVYSEDENGNPVYDFEYINGVYKRLLAHGIKPIVELDFLPEKLKGSSGNVTQEGTDEKQFNRFCPNNWDKWRALLEAFMKNLVEQFGLEELRTWYFEVWNEPDNWPIAAWDMFFKLYDVFVDVVTSVDDKLRVGGPGCYQQYFLFPFLEHVANGTNYVTGKKGTRIDFVSFHIYGTSGAWLKEYPLVIPTVQKFSFEIERVRGMMKKYLPNRNTEFLLNEWGVISNYERSVGDFPILELRNSEYSALFMTKLADTVLEHRHYYNFNISMMVYWGYANEDFFGTLFNGNRSLTTKYNICKPIQTAHEFFSLLGKNFVKTNVMAGGDDGVIAAADENGAQALLYYFNEFDADKKFPSREYNVHFADLADGKYLLKVYTMDDTHNNTYRLWQRMGSPTEPTEKQLKQLHAEQDVTADTEKEIVVKNGKFDYTTSLSSVSMKLISLKKL